MLRVSRTFLYEDAVSNRHGFMGKLFINTLSNADNIQRCLKIKWLFLQVNFGFSFIV